MKATFAGKAFSELASTDQDKVLAGLETGSITLKDVKGGEFFALLLPNTQAGARMGKLPVGSTVGSHLRK